MCPQVPILDLPAVNSTSAPDLLSVLSGAAKSRRNILMGLQEARLAGNPGKMGGTGPHWGTEECLTLNINSPADVVSEWSSMPFPPYCNGGHQMASFDLRLPRNLLILECYASLIWYSLYGDPVDVDSTIQFSICAYYQLQLYISIS
jgi:hypothetical protein